MHIDKYHTTEDEDISFVVDSEKYPSILTHLRSKGISPGGHHSADTGFSEVVVGGLTIDQLNEALEDFVE